ncbi:hypothetical protein ACFXI0_09940 [Kitasatospora indigofera]|uniref:hypothetical protein n=1 Tax=Kitasatospora indigofera TaxID=67307 RepID=UPI0036B7C48F
MNVLSPGLTDPAMVGARKAEKVDALAARVPLGRLALPQIARAAVCRISRSPLTSWGRLSPSPVARPGGIELPRCGTSWPDRPHQDLQQNERSIMR